MKRIVVCVFACLLLMISANAEGFPVREKIHIGDSVEVVLSTEPFGIMYHRTNKDGRSGVITSNKGNIFGNSNSYVEYVIDEAADLREANFIFGTDSSFEVLQTQYDYVESELDASYGESLGGIFGSNNGVNGYTYRFYDAYKSELSSYPDIVRFSERVVILENYNVKIEHLLLRRSSDYGVEYHHYLCYKGFLDSEAPLWAKKKNGFVYAGISNKLSNIDTSEKSEEYAPSEFDYSMLENMSISELTELRDKLDRLIGQSDSNDTAENSDKPTPSPEPTVITNAEILEPHLLINGEIADEYVYISEESVEYEWRAPETELITIFVVSPTGSMIHNGKENRGSFSTTEFNIGEAYGIAVMYHLIDDADDEVKSKTVYLIKRNAAANNVSNEFDFKSFNWGDPESKVLEIEGEPLYDLPLDEYNGAMLTYSTTAVGLDVYLNYTFNENGLFSTGYIVKESHSNPAAYIEDFEKFKNALISKYGAPIYDKENWTSSSKKSYYADNKGDALQYGYLSYEVRFETNTTTIVMTMDSDNYKISTNIVYLGKTIELPAPDYSDDI